MLSALKNTVSSVLTPQPLLDESTESWIIDTFLWAYNEFDGQHLLPSMQFILPTAEFFPEQVNSVEGMAKYVFGQVCQYAQMQAWPLRLVAPNQISQQTFPTIVFKDIKRGKEAQLVSASNYVDVSFNPNQVNQPQDLVASYAQSLAYINVLQSRSLPPGGKEFINQAVDLLASFMGFGVMMANTAYQFKGGCGSCYNPYANRNASLSEPELIYVLALLLKASKQSPNAVSAHLKPHLKSMLKRANKQLNQTIKSSAQPMLIALTEEM